jgi:hypothetical protein
MGVLRLAKDTPTIASNVLVPVAPTKHYIHYILLYYTKKLIIFPFLPTFARLIALPLEKALVGQTTSCVTV